jgi:integration host factor subunit beta
MTKAELVEEVAKESDLTKKDAEVIVQTVLDCITDALQCGEGVELRGFGSFRIRSRSPRQGRNPKTGSDVSVPAKKIPHFKPGKELRDIVNQ